MQIEERIPDMSDAELQNLHANAKRLAVTGAQKQQAEAARLLPIIDAAIAARSTAKAAAQVVQKEKRREAAAAARAAKPRVSKKKAAVA